MPIYVSENGILRESHSIELQSEEVQELLSRPPSWMVRCGITVIFALVCLVLSLSWVVKYPDTLHARLLLTSPHPPVNIVSHSTGRIDRLLVKEHQTVSNGQVVAVLENTATYADVLTIKGLLQASADIQALYDNPQKKLPNLPTNELRLGELQINYSAFVQSYREYAFFLETDYHTQAIAAIEEQIKNHQQLQENLHDQKALLQQDLSLTQKRFGLDSLLHSDSVIAAFDLDQSESALLQKKNTFLQTNTNRINSTIQLNELRKTIMDLKMEAREQSSKLRTALQQSLAQLQSQLTTWEQKYVLQAPIAGKVSLHKFWAMHQNVKTGDEVMTVVPDDEQLLCYARLPIAGAGKVQVGQRVLVTFDNFPYEEYGYVSGKVSNLSIVPRDSSYALGISLPRGLQTNYGKTLAFNQEMQGSAEVITEDLRLIERFLYQLRKAVHHL